MAPRPASLTGRSSARWRRWGAPLLAGAACLAGPAGAADTPLPAAVRAALAREKVPADALSVLVQDVDAARPLLHWQAQRPQNPASLFKLVTTLAALDLLGPAFTWTTPVWLGGPVREGVLEGDLLIKGQGDPKLVPEQLWLMMRRLQQWGVREIRGDIVLDRSAFSVPETSPAEFDGEPLRPYNARPDALLLAYRSVVYTFTPDPAAGVARVAVEPALRGLQVDAQVPLASGPCVDWRAGLKATPEDPQRMRWAGNYPAACGERQWPLAYAEPAGYNARLLEAMWRELGGRLGGRVRDGQAPQGAPNLVIQSPPLAELVREINKYSNNVMAQQVFYTLGLQLRGSGTEQAAREVLHEWLGRELGPAAEGIVLDNGSGLSRDTRISAAQLAQLLQAAWRGPTMPELLASLPIAGLDGTARNARAGSGRAHLKTGSLRDVAGIAGIVLGHSGRRYIVVALINHPLAPQARPAFDALIQGLVDDEPAPGGRRPRGGPLKEAPGRPRSP